MFVTGISYAALRDIRLVIFVPLFLFYLFLPWLKRGRNEKKALLCGAFGVVLAGAFFLAGMFRMNGQLEFQKTYLLQITEGENVTVLGEVSKIEKNDFGYQISISDCYILNNFGHIPCGNILVYASDPQFQVGEIHKITGKLHNFSTARNEGNFDAASYYRSRQTGFYLNPEKSAMLAENRNVVLKKVTELKARLANVYETVLGEWSAGIIKAMVLGDKSALDEEIQSLFTAAGISHILAISGLHVSVIGRGLYGTLRKIGCGFCISGIISAIVLVLYGIMTGNGISTRRAVGMLLISMMGQIVGRSYDMLNGLGMMCLFLLWENPFLIEYTGFWFFVTALFGIGFAGELLAEGHKRIGNAFWMSMGVTLVTLPVVAYCYFEIPVFSTMLNCMIIPLLTPLFIFALLGGMTGVFFLPLTEMLLLPCEWILHLYEWACEWVQRLPFSVIITGQPSVEKMMVYYGVLTGGILWIKYHAMQKQAQKASEKGKVIWKIALAVCCFTVILYQPQHPFEVTFLDVGQGDGIYLCDGEGRHFFIDGGSTDEKEIGKRRILPFLKSRGIKKIHYWFVTHADTDHISGLLEVLESGYEVACLVLPKAAPRDENYGKLIAAAKANETQILHMQTGDYIKTKTFELECLYPDSTEIEDRNESSLVLELRMGRFGALFTGDISSEQERKLAESGCLEDITLYKAAHHGSKGSNSMEFLQKLTPEIAVISCGADNAYGHPAKEAVEHIAEAGAEIYYTMNSGQITIRLDDTGKAMVGAYHETDSNFVFYTFIANKQDRI